MVDSTPVSSVTNVPKQPWYTSKSFWTLGIGFVFNVLRMAGVIHMDDTQLPLYINGILMLLGIVFRWTADQQLSFSPMARKL